MSKTINDLPNEMLLRIFSLCTVEDLMLSMQYVNKRWSELAQDSKMWKHLTYFPKKSSSMERIIKVLAYSPQLRSLILLENVNELLVNVICACCPLMENLEFYDIRTVTVDMLEKILKSLPNLKALSLRSMDIESQKFADVLGKFHTLKKLSLMHTFYMGADLLRSVADGCKSLECLRLDGIDVIDSVVQYFISVKGFQLTSLFLDGFRLTSGSLKGIKICVNLEAFMFHDCTTLTEDIFLDIVALPKLRILQLPEARQICSETLITGLRQMNLADLTDLDLSKSFLDDEGARCLSENCQQLKYLNLATCMCLTDCALKYISHCCSLQHLNIKNCGFTDSGMKYLPDLLQLRYLNISKNNITDIGMKYVTKCSQLTGLQINFCSVSPASISLALASLKLTRFSCLGCKMFCADTKFLYSFEGRRLHFDERYSTLMYCSPMMN